MQHILSVDQFSESDLRNFVIKAYTQLVHHKLGRMPPQIGSRKILTNLFYEPSSRTFASFFSAMVRLGGHVIPIQEAGVYSSAVKGESLEDTIRTMQCYCDVIVLRHGETGAAIRASNYAEVPIINAGDGTGEHPTQALLDFFTILIERGWNIEHSITDCFDGLQVTMMGDLLHGRTVKSLSKLLRNYNVSINWVSPEDVRIPAAFVQEMDRESGDLNEVIADTDVLYVVRAQTERRSCTGWSTYGVTAEHMALAKPTMILMHPLPRTSELPIVLDKDARSAYFRQMRYGLFMRMAVLETVLSE